MKTNAILTAATLISAMMIAACNQMPEKAVAPSLLPAPCENAEARTANPQAGQVATSNLPDCGGGGGGGGPTPPPPPPPASPYGNITLKSWDELETKATQLNLTLGEAASPNIEAYLAAKAAQNSVGTLAYPIGTGSTTEFNDKLFLNSPLVFNNVYPLPPANPNDPCVTQAVDFISSPNAQLNIMGSFPSVVWPGGIYQGNSIFGSIGSLTTIPLAESKRKPLNLESDSVYLTRTNVAPNSGAVYQAIGSMMQQGQSMWGNSSPSDLYVKVVQASSLREVSVKTGMNFSGYGATVEQSLDASTSSSASSVYVVFWQTLFNVAVTENGRPLNTLFNNTLTVADLEDLGMHDEVGYTNLPTFIRSVSYGRALIARYSSTIDINELNAALNIKFDKGGISAARNMEAHYKRIINNSSIEVKAIGGSYALQSEALKTDGWKDYFKVIDVPLNSLTPINFSLKRWDNNLAKISNTLQYVKRTCPAAPSKIELKIENRLGDTEIYLTKATGGPEQSIVVLEEDSNQPRTFDITSSLSGGLDTLRVHSRINKYGFFGTSKRNTKVTVVVDGLPLTELAVEDSCSTCHSANIRYYRVNKLNGQVD